MPNSIIITIKLIASQMNDIDNHNFTYSTTSSTTVDPSHETDSTKSDFNLTKMLILIAVGTLILPVVYFLFQAIRSSCRRRSVFVEDPARSNHCENHRHDLAANRHGHGSNSRPGHRPRRGDHRYTDPVETGSYSSDLSVVSDTVNDEEPPPSYEQAISM